MTEGIIDKIIRKHTKHNEFETRYINLEHGFEQELKDEIKKLHRHYCGDNINDDYCFDYVLIKELLGDGEKKE